MNHPKHEAGPSCAGCDSRMLQAAEELRKFFYWAKSAHHDLHCSWAYRGEADQNAAKASGASNAKFGESKHNVLPSQAIDLFQIIDGKPVFDGVFCVRLFKASQLAGFKLRNGGDFKTKRGGKLVSLGDYGHFEV